MKNLILITGDEVFERQEKLKQIKENFGELIKGINYIELDKDSLFNLEDEINTYPFGYSKKLIIVKNDKKEKKEKAVSASKSQSSEEDIDEKSDIITPNLEKELSSLENVTVVFIGEFQKRSKLYKFVEKHGECFVCEKKKEYELLSWCSKIFKENSVQISNSDITYLISLCGNDKLTLKNEINKLIDYSYDTKKIQKDDIDKICIRTSSAIIFDLTDCLGSKNTLKAIALLNELIENKEPIQKIVIMIAKHFKSVLIAKIANMHGKNLMDELSTKSSYAATKYLNQSKYFELQELINIIKELGKLDVDSKTGMIDLKIGLERIICS